MEVLLVLVLQCGDKWYVDLNKFIDKSKMSCSCSKLFNLLLAIVLRATSRSDQSELLVIISQSSWKVCVFGDISGNVVFSSLWGNFSLSLFISFTFSLQRVACVWVNLSNELAIRARCKLLLFWDSVKTRVFLSTPPSTQCHGEWDSISANETRA